MNEPQFSGSTVIGIKEQLFNGVDHFPIAGSFNGFDGIYKYESIPQNGNYIVIVKDGKLQFLEAPSGSLKLLNNSLQWTDTEECQ